MKRDIGSDQAETIAFLMRSESYGETQAGVERIDTHGAMIFLVGERAYKLKRAVTLPYLDFSTPEKRRAVCERELALNRRTAPSLYLGVTPIRRDAGGGLNLGGAGDVVDWVIVMRRFPEGAVLGRLSAQGRLDPGLMPRLARTIRRFHARAEQASDAPWLHTLAKIIDTLNETLLGDAAAPWLARLRQELHDRTPLLRERQAAGHVRHCHGDLHLHNIVLVDGEPVPFDALEFDETLATIDVLYDLAFLLMDLWHRGAKAEANAVLGVYLDGDVPNSDWAGLRLLPLFLSLRAAIRAMVGVHALAVVPESGRAEAEQAVRDYAALAAGLLAPCPPVLVCVGGLSGTGKTTVAAGLAPSVGAVPGAIHLRSDVERKLMFGIEPTSHLPADAYAHDVSGRVYRRVMDRAAAILSAGHSAILDAGFRETGDREAAARLAAEAGAAFHGLWLEADPRRLITRVTRRLNDASDAGRDVVLRQLRAPVPPAPADWSVIDANSGPAETLARAHKAVGL